MGKRCQVCIGCGRCSDIEPDGVKGIFIVTDHHIDEMQSADICGYDGCRRLVTVDIGTTTIAMQLHGADGRIQDYYTQVNPQIKYGADVLSRIEAAKESRIAEEMRAMVSEVLKQGFEQFQKHLMKKERLLAIVAANTTMVYLLMGYDTKELGQAPFWAEHLNAIHTEIAGVECLIAPGLSAFVGSDIVAGMLACEMWKTDEMTLLIDLGTNGEMVLGNRGRMIACATAAGPAFEGGVNRGIWGADMIRLLEKLLQEEIMDETGLLADEYFDTGVRIGDVCVTQESIRAVQLAKSAIRAGIEILLKEYGITYEQVDRVILAGGFGYYLSPTAAATIGLLPQLLASKTASGGNTALAGAMKLGSCFLQGQKSVEECVDRSRVQVLNLATVPEFEKLYLEYLNFI